MTLKLGIPATTNQAVCHIIPDKSICDTQYLFHCLQSKMPEFLARRVGGAQPNISQGIIRETLIPLPPLAEQQRIAAILDKADALREKRRQALAKLDALLQSVFLEMFGDPVTNPKGWSWGKISDLCDEIIDCPHSTPSYAADITPYACLRSSDIQNGFIDKAETKYVYLEEYIARIQRSTPKKGDVIYCREGARFGNAARIIDDSMYCLGQRMMLLRAAQNKGTPEYIWSFLNCKNTYQQMVKLVGGSAAPHVNVGEIKLFAVPIPPVSLQEQFADVIQDIDKLRTRFHMSSDMNEVLFNSLQQRAFNGELFTEKAAAAIQQELFAE